MRRRIGPLLALLAALAILLGVIPTAEATAIDTHFLVPSAAGCTTTAIATDADCWSHSAGGAGGAGVPGTGNAASTQSAGATAVTQDAALSPRSLVLSSTGWSGTWNTGNFDLTTFNGALAVAAGTFNAGSSLVTVGGGLQISGGTFNAQTSTIDITGESGHLDFTNCVSCTFNRGTSTIRFVGDTGHTANNAPGVILNSVTVDSGDSLTSQTMDFSGTVTISGATTVNPDEGYAFNGQVDGVIVVSTGITLTISGTDNDIDDVADLDVDGSLVMNSVTASAFRINRGGAAGNIDITTWTTYDATTPDIQWTMDPSDAALQIVFEFSGLPSGRSYTLFRNGNSISTDSDGNTVASFTVTSGWGSGDVMRVLQTLGTGGDVIDDEDVDYGFPPATRPTCNELTPVDWLIPTTQPGSLNVTIEDRRREAGIALQYLVSWGDGSATIVPKTPISHTYAVPDIYTITMRIQYRDGSIHLFVAYVDLRGNNCALSQFVNDVVPILGLLGGLTAVGALIVTLSQRKKTVVKRLRRYLLVVTVITFGIIIAVVIYMRAAGIPY